MFYQLLNHVSVTKATWTLNCLRSTPSSCAALLWPGWLGWSEAELRPLVRGHGGLAAISALCTGSRFLTFQADKSIRPAVLWEAVPVLGSTAEVMSFDEYRKVRYGYIIRLYLCTRGSSFIGSCACLPALDCFLLTASASSALSASFIDRTSYDPCTDTMVNRPCR